MIYKYNTYNYITNRSNKKVTLHRDRKKNITIRSTTNKTSVADKVGARLRHRPWHSFIGPALNFVSRLSEK